MANWLQNPISTKAKAPAAAGKPAGFAWEHDKSQHIVYRGQDQQIHELWFQHGVLADWKYGGALSQLSHSPAAAGDPSAFAWEGDKTQHIVYRGQDSQIHELWFKKDLAGARWQYGGSLSANAGAPAAAGDPMGYVWEEDKTQHIIYRAVDNNIHELFFKKSLAGAKWEHGGALNVTAGAPAAAGDPAGFTWEEDKSQHIVYRAADNNIHELWYQRGVLASWKSGGALTGKGGIPQAAGEPMGYAWEQDKTQHIVYRSPDSQVQELWYAKGVLGGAWKYGGAITSKTGAVPSAGDPFGFSWEGDKTQHIVYRGTNNQIHELWFRKELTSAEWKYGGALAGPQAGSDPIGFAWEVDRSQHIIYRGADNQIHEVWFKK